MDAATGNRGFFQREPVLQNQFYDDVSYQRILKLFLPPSLLEEVEGEVSQLGQDVLSPEIFNHVTDAERNLPYLRGNGRNSFGKQTSELVTGEGWRKLQAFGIEKGIIASNYDATHGQYSRLVQMLRIHLWEGSNGMTLCPGAMTDGATRLLELHLAKKSPDPTLREVLQNAYGHLTSRDPSVAWTSGQWMTERPGGSDVSRTETVATYAPWPSTSSPPLASKEEGMPLGPWSISGFKFFSSATDANMAILLARTTPDKGLSAFFAPMRRAAPESFQKNAVPPTELNGARIQRLKDKLGTRPVPTAELELDGMRGWLLGDEGRGIHEVSTILTITRVHSAVASLGYLGRGLAVARAFALVREVGGGRGRRLPLCRSALHMRTLAGLAGEYHGLNLLAFYTVFVLGLDERGAAPGAPPAPAALAVLAPPAEHVAPLLRVLGSLHKGYVCKAAVPLLHACLEALGGVGYLNNAEAEPLNVARLFRDGCVNPIWEGTTDVLAADFLRAAAHPRTGAECLAALDWLVRSALGAGAAVGRALPAWEEVKARIEDEGHDALLPDARDIMFLVAEVLIAALLVVDAGTDGAPEMEVVLQRFLVKRGFLEGGKRVGPEEGLELDTAIVYGRDGLPSHVEGSKL